jgi:hypothetical protein
LLKEGDILESAKAVIALSAEGGGRIHIKQNNITTTSVQSDGIALRKDDNENVILHNSGSAQFGGSGSDGNIGLFKNTQSIPGSFADAAIHLSANNSKLIMRNNGSPALQLDGQSGTLTMGSTTRLRRGNLRLGGANGGDLLVYRDVDVSVDNPSEEPTIHLNGANGHITANDVILRSADCAEEFDTVNEQIEPGTVMTIDKTGKLCVSNKPYDKKVIGVVSGAGSYSPGLILDKQRTHKNRAPIALLGKVYCKLDANVSSIEQGDLLTTSDIPGHAMKAIDPLKSFGAVIGKALQPIKKGKDLIPILVTLQ